MGIGRLSFSLVPGPSGPRTSFRILVDGREYLTSCFLLDDLLNLFRRYSELGEEGRRFDLFFSNSEPYSVSVTRRGRAVYLRISDNFDGGVLEQSVAFRALRTALEDLAAEALGKIKTEPGARDKLRRGLEELRRWSGPLDVD
jgi:hypothetical protein